MFNFKCIVIMRPLKSKTQGSPICSKPSDTVIEKVKSEKKIKDPKQIVERASF